MQSNDGSRHIVTYDGSSLHSAAGAIVVVVLDVVFLAFALRVVVALVVLTARVVALVVLAAWRM